MCHFCVAGSDSSDGRLFFSSIVNCQSGAKKAFRRLPQELFADIMNLLSFIWAKKGLDPTEKFNVPIYQPEGSSGMY